LSHTPSPGLVFPFPEAPAYGEVIEVADDILWTRIPLPFRLDHVNVYLIRDGESWTLVDTGINTAEAMAAWETLFAGPLAGKRISRVIVTHHHPDHIGLAGWLCRKLGADLLTSQTAYMTCKVIGFADYSLRQYFDFYVAHGMSAEGAGIISIQGNEYLRLVSDLPPSYLRLVHTDSLRIGTRDFRVITVDGHSAEQIMLYCDADKLLIAADQVIEKITPNISVYADEPDGDPLGHFLRALRGMRAKLPEDALVLSGHRLPFYGLHQRCAEFEDHHEERCQIIRDACRVAPCSVASLVPALFPRKLDPHQMSFAFTETLAHVNRLVRRGELRQIRDGAKFLYAPADAPETGAFS
jgi:glyoxylase-like metal-dependent hydrolase (beta-lactamase superfamily II)